MLLKCWASFPVYHSYYIFSVTHVDKLLRIRRICTLDCGPAAVGLQTLPFVILNICFWQHEPQERNGRTETQNNMRGVPHTFCAPVP
jgi:hypothetical protein